MILESQKVFYTHQKAEEISTMLQKNDPEWNYVKRDFNINESEWAFIEVLDPEGFHLGYI